MKKFLFNWIPVIAYVSLIFVVSSLPVHVAEPTDKFIHFFEYAAMGFFTTRALMLTFNLPRAWGLILGGLSAGLFGVLDELHQYFVPGRNASVGDALTDMLGGFAGAAIFLLVGLYLYRSQRLYTDPHGGCC